MRLFLIAVCGMLMLVATAPVARAQAPLVMAYPRFQPLGFFDGQHHTGYIIEHIRRLVAHIKREVIFDEQPVGRMANSVAKGHADFTIGLKWMAEFQGTTHSSPHPIDVLVLMLYTQGHAPDPDIVSGLRAWINDGYAPGITPNPSDLAVLRGVRIALPTGWYLGRLDVYVSDPANGVEHALLRDVDALLGFLAAGRTDHIIEYRSSIRASQKAHLPLALMGSEIRRSKLYILTSMARDPDGALMEALYQAHLSFASDAAYRERVLQEGYYMPPNDLSGDPP